jgi:hypothetical protein
MNLSSTDANKKKDAPPVNKTELNAWKRGFTPQAEIWNGRMASVGLILGLFVLILANNLFGGK